MLEETLQCLAPQPGETVLVTGAGGGLGVHTIQIAKLCGGRVIAVTGGPEKAKRLEELGADEVIVSRLQTLRPGMP